MSRHVIEHYKAKEDAEKTVELYKTSNLNRNDVVDVEK